MSSIQQVCEQLPTSMHFLLWAALITWEYGLGKTKFGSSAQLFVEEPIKKLLKLLHLEK